LAVAGWSISLLVSAPEVWAAGKNAGEIKSQERAAKRACLTGDFSNGVEILADLFIKTGDANHIFNQGRCFEQNNRYEDAIARFREYLRNAKNASPEDRADAEKHIAECRALLGEKRSDELDRGGTAAPASPPAAAPAPAPAATSPVPVPQPAVLPPAASAQIPGTIVAQPAPYPVLAPALVVAQPAPPPPATNAGRGLRIAGIACGVLGLASVGTGIYFYAQARSYSDKVSKQKPPDPADQDAGKQAETMQWVFYSIGGAAIATGTVLYILGSRAADATSASAAGTGVATIAPMFGPGLAGILAQGAF